MRTEQAVARFLGDFIASADLKDNRIAIPGVQRLPDFLPARKHFGVFHNIALKVRRFGVTAHLRSGYYDVPVEKTPVSAAPAAELDTALEKPLRGMAIHLRVMLFEPIQELNGRGSDSDWPRNQVLSPIPQYCDGGK